MLLLVDHTNNSKRLPGRVADRPRLSSWGAGRGAGPGLLRAFGWRVCLGAPRRRWSSCRRGPVAPRGVSGVGCSSRWLVVRWPLGRRFVLCLNDGWHLDVGSQRLSAIRPGEMRCPSRRPGIRVVLGPYVGHQTPRTSRVQGPGVSGSNMEPRATRTFARQMRVGLNVTWTSKTPRTARPSWSGASGPSYARGRRHGPCDARWRRGRVGRAVIRDVAIRAAPVRCPHKWAPNHAPALHPTPGPRERGGDVTERRPSSHTSRPRPRAQSSDSASRKPAVARRNRSLPTGGSFG
jgi:hypothetical protein